MQPQTKNKSKIFGSLFRFYRIQAGYGGDKGIVELASLLGKSRNTIYNWENSDMAPPNIPYDKVGELFGINPNRLKFPAAKIQVDENIPPTIEPDSIDPNPLDFRIDEFWNIYNRGKEKPDVVREEIKPTDDVSKETLHKCFSHFSQFLETIKEDPVRLNWTLVELQEHFPVGKFSKERRRTP